jgi:acyl-CoA thioesterase-1
MSIALWALLRTRRAISTVAIALVAIAAMVLPNDECAAAAVNIVAFGDSWTYGRGVAREEAYPAQLEAALRAKGFDVSVHNEGVNGDTTEGALARVSAAVPQGTQIAIVQFGINDERRNADAAATQVNMRALVGGLRARGIQVVVIGTRVDFSNVARSNGARYVSWSLGSGPLYGADGHHPSAAGHRALLARLLPTVEGMIGRKH